MNRENWNPTRAKRKWDGQLHCTVYVVYTMSHWSFAPARQTPNNIPSRVQWHTAHRIQLARYIKELRGTHWKKLPMKLLTWLLPLESCELSHPNHEAVSTEATVPGFWPAIEAAEFELIMFRISYAWSWPWMVPTRIRCDDSQIRDLKTIRWETHNSYYYSEFFQRTWLLWFLTWLSLYRPDFCAVEGFTTHAPLSPNTCRTRSF